MAPPMQAVVDCEERYAAKVRYVLDTLFLAAGIPLVYAAQAPNEGPWLFYGATRPSPAKAGCIAIAHCPDAWRLFDGDRDVDSIATIDGVAAVFPQRGMGFDLPFDIPFDIVGNAFYFLSSWSERATPSARQGRWLYAASTFSKFAVPNDIVDQYLERLLASVHSTCNDLGMCTWTRVGWPQGRSFAVVLSHDVDYVSTGVVDVLLQGARTTLRHLVRHRDAPDAVRSLLGLGKALVSRRPPFNCIPEIIAREQELGVRSSIQVAAARRHPADVNYRIDDARVRNHLRVICDLGFDLCLHGSYRSTERPHWYCEEVAFLRKHLGNPCGSRQHYLSFDYDALFRAQESCGIQYDMSMGFADYPSPRAGFSYPYFPFCLDEDRPYDVVQISLLLMDATLSGYLRLKAGAARELIHRTLASLQRKGGCISTVWHPIVFGGARDPGYSDLYWDMVQTILRMHGLATDGRTVNKLWRSRARNYDSFRGLSN